MNIQKKITTFLFTLAAFFYSANSYSQNSLTGDGFGGRSWYVAHNYQAGAYSGFTVCGPNNQLYAWGGNIHGELGIGTLLSTSLPVTVPGMTDVKFYTTGYISGVIKNDNTAWIWGAVYDFTGMVITPNPTRVLSDVKFVDGGISHVVFVKNDGTVWAAGRNYKGELGNAGVSSSPLVIIPPVQMAGITNAVRAISIGGLTGSSPASMILLADGTVKITGGNGQFMQVENSVPVTLPGLTNIVDIKGNNIAAFALNASGEVYSFGTENTLGSLGLGVAPFTYMPPTKISFPAGAAPIIALSANNDGFSALALDENGKVYGWGYNVHGELGDGTFITRNSPVLVATNVKDIFAGETFSYILKADNSLWATGRSGYPNTGGFDYGSIWMNQTNTMRNNFTPIDPTVAPWNLCSPKPYGNICPGSVHLGNDSTICNGQSLILNPGILNASYLWQDNSVNSNYTVTRSGTYWVTVTQNGCKYRDTIVVALKDCNCIQTIPNAFTPNGDGFYDQWIISKLNCILQVDVAVYNRYGSLVYEKKNYQNDWNGTYGNKPLPDATYYYVVTLKRSGGGQQILKGNVTILR